MDDELQAKLERVKAKQAEKKRRTVVSYTGKPATPKRSNQDDDI